MLLFLLDCVLAATVLPLQDLPESITTSEVKPGFKVGAALDRFGLTLVVESTAELRTVDVELPGLASVVAGPQCDDPRLRSFCERQMDLLASLPSLSRRRYRLSARHRLEAVPDEATLLAGAPGCCQASTYEAESTPPQFRARFVIGRSDLPLTSDPTMKEFTVTLRLKSDVLRVRFRRGRVHDSSGEFARALNGSGLAALVTPMERPRAAWIVEQLDPYSANSTGLDRWLRQVPVTDQPVSGATLRWFTIGSVGVLMASPGGSNEPIVVRGVADLVAPVLVRRGECRCAVVWGQWHQRTAMWDNFEGSALCVSGGRQIQSRSEVHGNDFELVSLSEGKAAWRLEDLACEAADGALGTSPPSPGLVTFSVTPSCKPVFACAAVR